MNSERAEGRPMITKLKAGPELDHAVILDVMGWKPWESDYVEDASGQTWNVGDDVDYDAPRFNPSTDIAAAFVVIEKLASQDYDVNISMSAKLPNDDIERWYCHFQYGDDNAPWRPEYRLHQAWAPTAALAICLAALEAVRQKKKDEAK